MVLKTIEFIRVIISPVLSAALFSNFHMDSYKKYPRANTRRLPSSDIYYFLLRFQTITLSMISLILSEIMAAYYNDAHFSRVFYECVAHERGTTQ